MFLPFAPGLCGGLNGTITDPDIRTGGLVMLRTLRGRGKGMSVFGRSLVDPGLSLISNLNLVVIQFSIFTGVPLIFIEFSLLFRYTH